MTDNGDKTRVWTVDAQSVYGLGNFTKTLPHNEFGEVVDKAAFDQFVNATATIDGSGFETVPGGGAVVAPFVNPRAGLANDPLVSPPTSYEIQPAPPVDSDTVAAEMTELYWMARLRDLDLNSGDPLLVQAAAEIDAKFSQVSGNTSLHLQPGIDVPGGDGNRATITEKNVFRLGLPGEELGPMISQFFLRPISFGTQTINQRERPYKEGLNFLTDFKDWLKAQNTGFDGVNNAYPKSNEFGAVQHSMAIAPADFFEPSSRYISSMRDLARFVNKDALHQAYFNAALILLSGGAAFVQGNPYRNADALGPAGHLFGREAGFGVLGGPHILALVSEVATRALKTVWRQKWQVHLRLRPEAYAGHVHAQTDLGRAYGLPAWLTQTDGAKWAKDTYNTWLLPMAFTAGSPAHPAYGAGHATVAGACVTVLKAYFATLDANGQPINFSTLKERPEVAGELLPYAPSAEIRRYRSAPGQGENRTEIRSNDPEYDVMTIEGELNKLAQNVAMGRTMGGVHWRTDNARSLILGEAMAVEILAGISRDVVEKPEFMFRTFSRKANGEPKVVRISRAGVTVDNTPINLPVSAL